VMMKIQKKSVLAKKQHAAAPASIATRARDSSWRDCPGSTPSHASHMRSVTTRTKRNRDVSSPCTTMLWTRTLSSTSAETRRLRTDAATIEPRATNQMVRKLKATYVTHVERTRAVEVSMCGNPPASRICAHIQSGWTPFVAISPSNVKNPNRQQFPADPLSKKG